MNKIPKNLRQINALTIIIFLCSIFWLMPLVLIFINSFKPYNDMIQDFLALPKSWSLAMYIETWTKFKFPMLIGNTLLYTFCTVIMIVLLALGLVALNTLAICMLEPQLTFMEVLFETVSAFGTVGLSTGITPELCWASKLILALTMFCGRLGPVTMACIWHYQPPSGLSYAEERVTIG